MYKTSLKEIVEQKLLSQQVLAKQRDQLRAVAGVVDQKLANIARDFKLPLRAARDVCLLNRRHNTSNAYWER